MVGNAYPGGGASDAVTIRSSDWLHVLEKVVARIGLQSSVPARSYEHAEPHQPRSVFQTSGMNAGKRTRRLRSLEHSVAASLCSVL